MEERYLFRPLAALKLVFGRNSNLLRQFVRRNVEARYKGSFLGIVWSFAQPLMMLAVYTFVFSVVFKAKTQFAGDIEVPFSLFMLCGMAVFSIFSESVNGCCNAVAGNPNFVKKVVFPLEILPVSQVLSTSILNLVWFVLLILGMLIFVHQVFWTMLLLPLVLIPTVLLALGCGFISASCSVYIRDLQYLIGVLVQVLFFMSPIFYSLKQIPETYRWVLKLNPLAMLIEQTRELFLFGYQPDYRLLGLLTLISYLVFHLGLVWFEKTKKGFADVI